MQAGGAVLQIFKRLPVGGLGVGIVHPHQPRPAGAAGLNGAGALFQQAAIEGGDGDGVIAAPLQPLEGPALEHPIHPRPPLGLSGGWENIGEGDGLL